MLQNNIPTTLPTIEKLLNRISSAERSQQKEIRITIQEARELTLEISLLTSKLASTINEINESLKKIGTSETIEVKFDGGGF
jgi:hypothetical protein